MKHRYLLIVMLLSFLAAILYADGWRRATSPTESSVSSSFFLFNSIGWYVGDNGLVKKTIDGGKTWTDLNTGITDNLKSVYFVNANIGFIGGSGGKLFKTINGGTSWSSITVTGAVTGSSNIVSIYFANEQKGWVVSSTSSAGKVLQTIDGGITWTTGVDNTAGDLEAMDFFNEASGIVVGGGVGKCDLYYTTNGATWTKATAPSFPAGYTRTDIRGVFMVNQNVAYATGWGSLIGAQASIHLKTIDGGATWTYLAQTEQNKTFDNMYSLYFQNENTGFVVGGALKGSVAARTVDGGINWVPVGFPSGATLNNISGFGNSLIVTTNSGTFFISTDFGDTWNLLTPIPNASLFSISTVNNNVIYAAGFDGLVLKSVDGGNNWTSRFASSNKVCPNIQAAYFVNENVGYLAQSYGAVTKTTNGGATWFQVMPDVADNALSNNGVHFVNADLGFVVGKKATNVDVIYKTVNGGTTWTEKNSIVAATLRAVAFADAQNGVVVGEKLKAAYTNDGGNTWQLSTFNNVPSGSASANLRDVVFLSNNNVVAVGDKIILHSTNGGAAFNFVNVSNLGELLTGVGFNSISNGWAVGGKSAAPRSLGVYQTADGGSNWTNKVDYNVLDVNGSINDVAVSPSGSVYICGGNSTIYVLSSPTNVGGDEPMALNYSLNQNYPNPFNPSTRIEYSIGKDANVSLKIFDLLGREISEVVNEYQSAGLYSVSINADKLSSGNRLSSGVYFYRLEVGGFVETKKMIYLR
jgi:photosystem II stability/assembly factor-like uncharacterized protein